MILLGAGASKPLGVPTMVEFTKSVIDQLEPEQKKFAEQVLASLAAWADGIGVTADLESLLQALKALTGPSALTPYWPQLAALQRNPPVRDSSKEDLLAETTAQIERAVESTCKRIDKRRAVELYEEFFLAASASVLIGGTQYGGTQYGTALGRHQISGGRMIGSHKVFTTNYDLGIETCLSKLAIPYADGFDLDRKHADMTLQLRWDQVPGGFQLFKLHGSIDYYLDQLGRVVKLKGPPGETFLGETYGRQLMIFPTEEKYVTKSPFYELFLEFRSSLRTDNLVLIVGSSLRDQPILNALEDTVPSRTNVKVVVVAPRANEVCQSLSEAVRAKCVIMNAKFGSPGFANELSRAIAERQLGEEITYLPE